MKRTAKGGDPRDWDNLYTSGQAGADATTGEVKWFYQHTPILTDFLATMNLFYSTITIMESS